MERKYTVYTVDPEIIKALKDKQTQAYQTSWKAAEGFQNIWRAGYDPNNQTAIIILPEIKK